MAFLAGWAVLGFLSSLLLNIIDALFVCVAMDRDVQAVRRPRPWQGAGHVQPPAAQGPAPTPPPPRRPPSPPASQESHPEVVAVICKLPTVGAVVLQPDGEMAYGAVPSAPRYAQPSAPPAYYYAPPAPYPTPASRV